MPNISFLRLHSSGFSPASNAAASPSKDEEVAKPSHSRANHVPSADSPENSLDPKDVLDISEQTGAEPSESSQAELSESDRQRVDELKKRDLEVRAHEQAHVAAAGQYTSGGPSYTYETGPDGQRYAVGGEVPIDISPVSGDPEATIDKMRALRRAAQAPADPSAADRSVAAKATQSEVKAQQQLHEARREEAKQTEDDPPIDDTAVGHAEATGSPSPTSNKTTAETTASTTAKQAVSNPTRLQSDLVAAYSNNPVRVARLDLFA